MHYRKDIQGLRALAVLFVFIFHLNPEWMPGGFIGVDVFFVISGFLVSNIILRNIYNGSFSFAGFYIARIKRIVPAYYFMLLCTAIAAAIIIVGNDIDTFQRTLKHAIIFNSDYCFATMNSYFGMEVRQNPLLHTWTIATEMKFYLLLPLLLFFAPKKYLPHILIVIAVILLCYSVYEIQFSHHRSVAYYSLPIRIPEFLTGVFLAVLSKKRAPAASGIKIAAGFTGIAVLILCGVFFNHKTTFPGVTALIPCAGAALLLFSDVGPVSALLSKKPFVAVGALSYSIYLWHWPVMALTRYYYDTDVFSKPQLLFVTALTALCSIISYSFAEKFFRGSNVRKLVFGIAPVAGMLVLLFIFIKQLNGHVTYIPKEYTESVFGAKSHNVDFVETLGDTLNTKLEIFLMGNSHALSLKAYFDYIGKRRHFSFRTITSNTYFPMDGLDINEVKARRYDDFVLAKQLIPTAQKEMAKSKVIIIVASSLRYVPSMVPALQKLITNLKEGQQLILVGTFPMLDKDPLRVNRGFVKNYGIEQHFKVKFKPRDAKIMQLVEKYPNVHYFDLSKGSTYDNAPYYNDTVMYYDRKHLNKFGAVALAKDTEARFMQLLDSIK